MAPAAAYTAVVTGISGFIASELAHQLLAKGYVVRGTVRSKQNTEKVGHLLRLAEVGRLQDTLPPMVAMHPTHAYLAYADSVYA